MDQDEIINAVLEKLPEEKKAEFVADLTPVIEVACEHLERIWSEMSDMLVQIVDAVADIISDLVTPVINSVAEIIERTNAYRSVATGREWHCYCCCGKKVQNKWENEFKRRLRKKNGGKRR